MTAKKSHSKIAVLGAGPSGLFTAHGLVAEGYQVALFESHSKPGGCASYFARKPLGDEQRTTFDAGATILNRMGAGEFLDRLLRRFKISLKAQYQPIESIEVKLPGEALFKLKCANSTEYLAELKRAFPTDALIIDGYLSKLATDALKLQKAFEKIPHLPVQNMWDLKQNLKLMPELLTLAPTLGQGFYRSFGVELKDRGISDRLFRWIEMNLLITLQCSAYDTHPLYGALGVFFYCLGAGTLDGGMKSLFLPMLEALQAKPNARVYTRSPVQKISLSSDGKFVISAMNNDYGPFDAVFSSLPRFDSQNLITERLMPSQYNLENLESKLWSAFVGYVVVKDSENFPDEAFHLHSSKAKTFSDASNGGDVYISFSKRGDALKTPLGTRSATLSTHIPLQESAPFLEESYTEESKAALGRSILLPHLKEAYPFSEVIFDEYGSPRTFLRYTRRSKGTVGGLPLSREFSFFNAPPQRTVLKNFYIIGDTSFPGQSVYACAVGSCAVIEKYMGRKLEF